MIFIYKRNAKRWYKHADFILLDVIIMVLSLLAAYCIRYQDLSVFEPSVYRETMLELGLASMLSSVILNSYHNILKRGFWIEFKCTVIHVSLSLGLLLTMFFFRQAPDYTSRKVIFFTFGIGLVCSYLGRIIWKHFVLVSLKHFSENRKVFLVTSEADAEAALKQLKENALDFQISGLAFLDRDAKGENVGSFEIICNLNEVIDFVVRNVIDEVFFCAGKDILLPDKIISECQEMGITTHVRIELPKKSGEISYVEGIGGFDFITTSMKVATKRQLLVKRLMDIVGGLVGCIITGLLCLYVVPKIKKAEPGPAFFSQTRIGKHGREFKIYKFRSMYLDAEKRKKELMDQNEMNGVMFKINQDPRILPGIGEFIRSTSIDEFPQFFNVLKGDMSLVGTRPPLPSEVVQYDLKHFQRLAVKPGITGLWQASGRNQIVDFDEIVKLDSRYIREWNIGMDIRILLKTVWVVLKKEGAS